MSATALFSLISSMASIQIGIVISSFLFGIVTLQAFFYCSNYPKDRLYLKIFSALVWTLELCGMIFSAHLVYSAAITPYRESPILMFLDPPYQILATVFVTNCSGCVVQLYFIDRVRRFTKLIWPAVICVVLVLYTWIGVLILVIIAAKKGLVEYTLHWRWLSISGWIVSAVVDIFLAMMLSWNLARQRNFLFRRSTTLIHKIISMTITTGLLTSIVAVLAAILNILLPYHLIYMGVYICLARIYANFYFASLNARHTLRGGMDDNDIETLGFTTPSNQSDSNAVEVAGSRRKDGSPYIGQFKVDLNSSNPTV